MKTTVKSAATIIVSTVFLCVVAAAISRQNAIRVADRIMLAALPAGWGRIEASFILAVDGQFRPSWWIRYADAERSVDFPPEVSVSLGGRILHTSLPKPAAIPAI